MNRFCKSHVLLSFISLSARARGARLLRESLQNDGAYVGKARKKSGRGGGKMSGGISSNRLLKGYDSKAVFQGLPSFLMGD